MNTPLVVFGEDWGSHPSSTQHLIRRLAVGRTIIWVNSIGLRWPRPTVHDLQRVAAKLTAAIVDRRDRQGADTVPAPDMPRLHIIDPLAIPASAHSLVRYLNRNLLAGLVRRMMRRHGLSRPILWISVPTAVDVVGSLGERAVVYYCGDDWVAMPGVDHAPVAFLEGELAAKADLILAASAVIAAKFPAAKTVLLPHGADIAQFTAGDAPRPADLPWGPPIAGYYGTLSEWMDTDLLAAVAAALPDWLIYLIGPVRTDVSALAALPNVVLAGPRPHASLPAYVRHWQVSLMPFRQSPMTQAFNPLKLREYLAAGTPLVTTDFPALDGYRDLVEVARSPEQFAAAIRRAGAEGRQREGLRQDRVSGETWEARAQDVDLLLARFQSAHEAKRS